MSDKGRQVQRARRAQASREASVFHAAIDGRVCVVCGRTAVEAREAGTRHQAHHAISKHRLKQLGLEEHLWAPANAVCVCEEPCHRRHTTGHQRIERDRLPVSVHQFAEELGLTWVLDKEYP